MKLRALAKINLGLDVVRRREDGYHEVRMVMQTINMYDLLELTVTESPGIRIQTNLYYLPCDENNLVYKAAKLLMDEFQITKGLYVKLDKFIPVAAGMAGGSSDAAATMVAVNRLFRLGLSLEQLMERGVKIGADVPYCIMRGTALAEGIGEILSPMPPMPPCHILIGKPPVSVSTKFVYGNLKANELERHPDIDGLIEEMKKGDVRGMCRKMENVLETVTIPAYPVIQEIKDRMIKCGAAGAMMSGSGPTVFGVFESKEAGLKAKEELSKSGLARQIFLTTPFNR
ncbi:MAG: 4-(cytidine 5'-diphospho)-2-C-methyl-D-erythritol kinase [Lachnospiraceae bacterium]|nr:4-(cytidine 5'-diphospho)-2-C-methyl-D-erythritol kinase [Lachnospiraceae bacterium]